jgi:serine/threonine-protein kinase
MDQLRKLVETCPGYAIAYSSLAEANGLLTLFGVVSGREVYPEVKARAERGHALDPESGETCAMLAGLRACFEYRWDEAESMYDQALKLQPGRASTR